MDICWLCCCKLFTPSDTSSGYTAPDWPGRAEGAWPCCRSSCTQIVGVYTSRWGCRLSSHPDRDCRVSLPQSRGSPLTKMSLREAERSYFHLALKGNSGRLSSNRSSVFAKIFIQSRPKKEWQLKNLSWKNASDINLHNSNNKGRYRCEHLNLQAVQCDFFFF